MGLARRLSCERVRAQVSLELDSELSQLERRMVASHLERCAECREFEHSVVSFTEALRSAPLEVFDRQIAVTRRRRVSFAQTQLGVAAALAVAVLVSAGQLAGGDVQREAIVPSLKEPIRLESTAQLKREIALILSRKPGALRGDETQGTTLPL